MVGLTFVFSFVIRKALFSLVIPISHGVHDTDISSRFDSLTTETMLSNDGTCWSYIFIIAFTVLFMTVSVAMKSVRRASFCEHLGGTLSNGACSSRRRADVHDEAPIRCGLMAMAD